MVTVICCATTLAAAAAAPATSTAARTVPTHARLCIGSPPLGCDGARVPGRLLDHDLAEHAVLAVPLELAGHLKGPRPDRDKIPLRLCAGSDLDLADDALHLHAAHLDLAGPDGEREFCRDPLVLQRALVDGSDLVE